MGGDSLPLETPLQDDYDPFQENLPWSLKPIGWYMDFALRPTVFALVKRGRLIYLGVFLIFLALSVGLAKGVMNMHDEPQGDIGTLQAIEHWPLTPALLLGATHLIVALYGQKQYHNFAKRERPPLPILFPFIIGKGFMMVRLVMAYSSPRMSYTLDFFVRQEIMLMLAHLACSSVILPLIPQRSNYLRDMVQVFRFVMLMDFGKTVANYFLWRSWTKGVVADTIDRLPDQASQICASLLIHALLDVLQSASTVFTMFISRWTIHMIAPDQHRIHADGQCNSDKCDMTQQKCSGDQRKGCCKIPSAEDLLPREELQQVNLKYYESFSCKFEVNMVIFSLVNMDGFWVRHLFKKGSNVGKMMPENDVAKNDVATTISAGAAEEIKISHEAYKKIDEVWIECFRWATCAKRGRQ